MGGFSNPTVDHRLHPDGSTETASVQQTLHTQVQPLFGVEDLLTLLHDLVYIIATVALIFVFFFRIVCVDGASMLPTLHDGDRLVLLSNVWYAQPRQGDIVVARIPEFSSDPIVKRVIAVEGDVLDIDYEEGVVYVNGAPLQEDYIMEATHMNFEEMGITFPVTIEENSVFLMGDNRNDSYDSRYSLIGQVDTRYILGEVIFLVVPGEEQMNARDYTRIGPIE